jgi:sterol O-acyltransferase
MIVSSEMVRMSMKMHAYFREKMVFSKERKNEAIANYIPDWAVKRGVTIEDLDKPEIDIRDFVTEIKRFTYFFFAPTLVYRDHYVYTKSISVKLILKHGFVFLFLVFYLWTIFSAICIPAFKDTVENPGSVK